MTCRYSFLNERPPLDAKTRENVARIAERAWRSGVPDVPQADLRSCVGAPGQDPAVHSHQRGKRRPLAEVNDAFDDMTAGRGLRTVLTI